MKPDKTSLLSVANALACVLREAKPIKPLSLELSAALRGLVLAEAVASDIDSPPFTKALMDGYAVASVAYASGSDGTLRVVEEIAAGSVPKKCIGPGEAARIMTGAPVPDGADAVVPIERTESISATEVRILASPKPGQHILQRATEMKADEVILQPGSELGPQEFGILASVGRTCASIHPRPRVGIVTTGDEIVEPRNKPKPGQIRNSNSSMLAAQVDRAGGVSEILGIAGDNVLSLRSMIGDALALNEVVILSGGVSAGKFDLVPDVLKDLGVIAHFHKVALKPGKPLFFGTKGDQLVFGLPGNPVSSFVCFELFIRPALRKLMGHGDCEPRQTQLPIAADFQTDNDRPTYWPARIEWRPAGPYVSALPYFGSADLRALHAANALLAIPPGTHRFATHVPVPVILLTE